MTALVIITARAQMRFHGQVSQLCMACLTPHILLSALVFLSRLASQANRARHRNRWNQVRFVDGNGTHAPLQGR